MWKQKQLYTKVRNEYRVTNVHVSDKKNIHLQRTQLGKYYSNTVTHTRSTAFASATWQIVFLRGANTFCNMQNYFEITKLTGFHGTNFMYVKGDQRMSSPHSSLLESCCNWHPPSLSNLLYSMQGVHNSIYCNQMESEALQYLCWHSVMMSFWNVLYWEASTRWQPLLVCYRFENSIYKKIQVSDTVKFVRNKISTRSQYKITERKRGTKHSHSHPPFYYFNEIYFQLR